MSYRTTAIIAVVTAINIACAMVASLGALGKYGSMPDDWADQAHVATGTKDPTGQNALAGMVGQVMTDAMPNGGPQAFECYTYDAHDTGITRLVLACIGNVEIAGAGRTVEVRGLQSGGVIRGTGQVDQWVGLHLSRPTERVPGQVKEYAPITFDNGWKFVQEGDQLSLCPPKGAACRAF